MRVVIAPWLFRLPFFRRFTGYALWRTILLRHADVTHDLLTHELCHIWQGQQRRWHMLFTYVTTRYANTPYEEEARRAVAETAATAP